MKIRAVKPELFQVDGRTNMTKLRVAFRNFVNTPQKRSSPSTSLSDRSVARNTESLL